MYDSSAGQRSNVPIENDRQGIYDMVTQPATYILTDPFHPSSPNCRVTGIWFVYLQDQYVVQDFAQTGQTSSDSDIDLIRIISASKRVMDTREGSFEQIPMIDLDDLTRNRVQLLDHLRYAILEVGFLCVKNTAVAKHEIDTLITLLPDLFDIPQQEKQQILLEDSPHFLGYSAVGSEITAGKIDQREQFEFTSDPFNRWRQGDPLYLKLHGPNQYPKSLPQARATIETYMSSLTEFANQFMQLVAEALGLPQDIFLPFLSGQNRLKIVRYPEASVDNGSQGVGPHKDSSGWWTFLLQASPPEVKGLQVLNKAGKWIDVPNVPGTFVVNIGQAFEVVTLGACKATVHRVLGGPTERYSVPFFLGVRGDLTKTEALTSLARYFPKRASESKEGLRIDSAFLHGKYDTWGEAQLRTKIRSHRAAGKAFYPDLFDQYINDD